MDVTERKLADEALSAINQRLIEAQEEERAHLARELHDDINQRLALLTTRLGGLAESESTTEGKRDIEETRQEVMSLTRDIQGISHRLHPPRLEYLGIGDAAATLCREISSQQGVQVCFQSETVPEDLPKRTSVCLYRVLQESLQNATKHSGAAKIEVPLRR